MRKYCPHRLLSTLAVLLTLGTAACADQTDQRLPQLFSDLMNAPNARAAAGVEQQIWGIWFESPNSAAREELYAARGAAEAGDPAAAMRLFDALVAAHPGYAEGWNQRAILRYLVGDVDGSIADIDRVLELEPRHFGALSGRGQCLLRQERYREALAAFEQALNINPWIESSARQIEMLKTLINAQEPRPI